MASNRVSQAVIVIHGIGEQKPMDTIRGFVESVLDEPKDGGEKYFSKPNDMSELFELRKLQNREQPRTHFFEYYWAHKMQGTTMSHVTSWLSSLLLRLPTNIPSQIKPLWYLSWMLIIAVLVLLALGIIGETTDPENQTTPFFSVSTALALVWGGIQAWIINDAGDAARYLSANPKNIAVRQAIRSDGIKLIRSIHESGEYDRVIVVGHSLGTVIGYDILKHLWQDYYRIYKNPRKHAQKKMQEVEKAGEILSQQPTQKNLDGFQKAQFNAWRELRELGNPWLVTDFITMGSPLTHAVILMAKSEKDLERRKQQRELPACPPIPETETGKPSGKYKYSYEVWDPYITEKGNVKLSVFHHAAAFGFTRWTNLYFPAHLGLFGDMIGGPLKKYFGEGIRDIVVTTSKLRGLARYTLLAHSMYWKKTPESDAITGDTDSLKLLKTYLDLKRINWS